MLRFSANLSFLFLEFPFMERFQRAKDCGFKGVDYAFVYDIPPKEIGRTLNETNLELVMLNSPPGDSKNGEFGLGALPHRKREFRNSINLALEHAVELQCKKIHVLSGIVPKEEDYALYFNTYIENLHQAADLFEPYGITLLIEPVNHNRIPGYLVEKVEQAIALINTVNKKNVALQCDFYHLQMSEGNLAQHFLENANLVQHIQIAGVPGRHEPNIGEINYPYLFNIIKKSGYKGWIGCEYYPITTTADGLKWLKEWNND